MNERQHRGKPTAIVALAHWTVDGIWGFFSALMNKSFIISFDSAKGISHIKLFDSVYKQLFKLFSYRYIVFNSFTKYLQKLKFRFVD